MHSPKFAENARGPNRIAKLLGWIAFRSATAPKLVLCFTLVITAIAGFYSATRLQFHTSRLALLSPDSHYNQRWLAYLKRFGNEDDAAIVISHADPKLVRSALEAMGQRLASDSQLNGVLYRKTLGNITCKAMHLLPTSALEQTCRLLEACSRTDDSALRSSIQSVLAEYAQPPHDHLARFLPSAVEQATAQLGQLSSLFPTDDQLLIEDEGRMGLCLVRMPHPDNNPGEVARILKRLSMHFGQVRQQFPAISLGLTGMPVLEWDESQSSQRDMRSATVISLAGVLVVFAIGFGSWRLPACGMVCLGIGLMWTLGATTLVVGHLSLFSISFGVILAGLGIDYSIHLLARLQCLSVEARQIALPVALRAAVEECGCGILTGAVTTSAAFFAAALTPFRGVAELGIISGIGILLCMLATLVVLPALLSWQALQFSTGGSGDATWSRSLAASRGPIWLTTALENLNTLVLRRPWACLTLALVLTAMLAVSSLGVRYDHNLLNLQAHDAPSVRAEQDLIRRSGPSTWFAVSIADSPRQARLMKDKFLLLPTVSRVEEVGSLTDVASDSAVRAPLVSRCQQLATSILARLPSNRTNDSGTNNSHDGVRPAAYSQTELTTLLPNELSSKIGELATIVGGLSRPDPPTLDDLSEPIRSRMVSLDRKALLLRIYSRKDIWQRENLSDFIRDIESVDPRVTGHPVQTYYASSELQTSYLHAAVYALLLVMCFLMIDFGSVRLLVVSMLPVGFATVQMLGLLCWLEIPLNAANMIVLPLILGIGIDNSVHIVHEYRATGNLFKLSGATSISILLTSLTTMVGFGSMAIADHRGLQSLGIVLLIGIGLCLLNSMFVLPPLLKLLHAYLPNYESDAVSGAVHGRPVPQTSSASFYGFSQSGAPLLLSLPICGQTSRLSKQERRDE